MSLICRGLGRGKDFRMFVRVERKNKLVEIDVISLSFYLFIVLIYCVTQTRFVFVFVLTWVFYGEGKWAFFKRSGLTETDWWDAVGTKDNIGSSASSREGIKCGNLVVVGLSERVVPGWTSLLMNIMPVVISC